MAGRRRGRSRPWPLGLVAVLALTAVLLPATRPAEAAVPAPAAPLGVHVVDVVLALPPGVARDATTAATVQAAVADVDAFYDRVSRGRIRFRAGAVIGWTRVRSRCALTVARRLATRLGLDTARSHHVVVYEPVSCPVAGVATVGGREVLLAANTTARALVHELGHNLGLDHSNASGCSVAFRHACSRRADRRAQEEYGDTSDVMGGADPEVPGGLRPTRVTGTLNPLQLDRLGVLPRSWVRRLDPTRALPQTVRLADRATTARTALPRAAVLHWSGRAVWLSYDPPNSYRSGRLLLQTRIWPGTLLLPVHGVGRLAGPVAGDTFPVTPDVELQVVSMGRSATLRLRRTEPRLPTWVSRRLPHAG